MLVGLIPKAVYRDRIPSLVVGVLLFIVDLIVERFEVGIGGMIGIICFSVQIWPLNF